jgi:cytochrome-b5 reductase
MIFVCGPPGFMEAISGDKTPSKEQGVLGGVLKSMGWKEEEVYKF